MTHFPDPSGLEVMALNILSAFQGKVAVPRQRRTHIQTQNTIVIQIESRLGLVTLPVVK